MPVWKLRPVNWCTVNWALTHEGDYTEDFDSSEVHNSHLGQESGPQSSGQADFPASKIKIKMIVWIWRDSIHINGHM